uniref:Uncharacterized protein n=1 Tax=Physcomitrium patens TaxID=3218 RepID=A0A2K1IFD2_PHYPA|nr:hypothetical protein PHYPA_028580 [Physcomitrium patens]
MALNYCVQRGEEVKLGASCESLREQMLSDRVGNDLHHLHHIFFPPLNWFSPVPCPSKVHPPKCCRCCAHYCLALSKHH